MEDSTISSGMIKMDALNYSVWKPMMEDLLDLYEPIVRDKIYEGVTQEDWRVLNRKAVGMIHFYINHNIFHHVANDIDAFKLW
jgi:hypothetical protein